MADKYRNLLYSEQLDLLYEDFLYWKSPNYFQIFIEMTYYP